MEARVSQSNPRKGNGFVSFIIGVATLAIDVLGLVLVIVAVLVMNGNPVSRSMVLLELLALVVGAPVFLAAMIANLVGLVLGIIAWRSPPAANQRRYAIAGVVINLVPALLICILMLWSFGAFGDFGYR